MVTIRGESGYCSFFILDPSFPDHDLIYESIEGYSDQSLCLRTAAGLIFGTSDKVNVIEINFELFSESPLEEEFTKWSKVAESSLQLASNALIVCTLPDGIDYPIGLIPLEPGSYILRIYYKDEYDMREDMENIDENERIYEQFKIQAWLGDLIPTKSLYSRSRT